MMIVILRTTTLNYPDWLPAAIFAVLIMLVLVISFVSRRNQPTSDSFGKADVVALITMLALATIGVFALLRMVI